MDGRARWRSAGDRRGPRRLASGFVGSARLNQSTDGITFSAALGDVQPIRDEGASKRCYGGIIAEAGKGRKGLLDPNLQLFGSGTIVTFGLQ